VPLAKAARLLNLSPLAVRKRCQRGTLDARKVDGEWTVRVTDRDRPLAQDGTDQDGPVTQVGIDRPIPLGRTRTGQSRPTAQAGVAGTDRDVTLALVEAWTAQLSAERERASSAEQAAAMWQERARNLEAENGRLQDLLALPAHEEAFEPSRRWWQWWRRGEQHAGA